jgi:hypothetical protein
MMMLLYILSLFYFGGLILSRPHLIMRPSVWFCLGMLVRINGAAAFNSSAYLHLHETPELLRFLTIMFPFGVAVWLSVSDGLSRQAQVLYGRCGGASADGSTYGFVEESVLKKVAILSFVIMVLYLTIVPLGATGIVTIFTNPSMAAMAREKSLKLISFLPLKYAFLWHIEFLGPVLVGLLILRPFPRTIFAYSVRVALIVAVIFSVSLSGARTPAGLVIMSMALIYLLRNGVKRGALVLVGAVSIAILIAMLLSIFREGKGAYISPALLYKYLSGGLFRRTLVIPFETGVMTNLYTQDHGLMGVSNIRPLAKLLGETYVRLPNLVGLTYMQTRVDTISANTSFFFDFQASFGLIRGWLVALVSLASLDFLIVAFRKLKGGLLIVLYAAFLTAQHTLVSSAFTTCLISHSILIMAFIAEIMGRYYNQWMFGRRE